MTIIFMFKNFGGIFMIKNHEENMMTGGGWIASAGMSDAATI